MIRLLAVSRNESQRTNRQLRGSKDSHPAHGASILDLPRTRAELIAMSGGSCTNTITCELIRLIGQS